MSLLWSDRETGTAVLLILLVDGVFELSAAAANIAFRRAAAAAALLALLTVLARPAVALIMDKSLAEGARKRRYLMVSPRIKRP